MKLASLPQGRDGRLIVVSDDLAWYADADHIVPTMQALLDDWDHYFPLIEALGIELAHDAIPRKRFHEREACAPLPRAYQWADGSAYVNHVELVRKARGAELPDSFWNDPLMYQGGSDDLRGAREPIRLADEAWGCDFEAEIVVVTSDVPQGVSPEQALRHIRLVGLVNDVSLRNLIPGELAKGFGFVQSKPASHFSPVFVTPDTLGDAWANGKLSRTLMVDLNGQAFGRIEAGEECTFDFGVLIAHLAKTRGLGAGSLIGSGTVSNRDPDGSPGRPVSQGGRGYACIAEQRMVETIATGEPVTPFLKAGDSVRIEMRDAKGRSIFGAIDHVVATN
ncbi:MAG: 2-keto-4-pentenoate hydratase [Novosphingobium sp. 17-62-19]|uniref:fumarylacetoacetate hydrolase family protein n=1 Tax=Novosphingobium sp. 17-62-19 TaxID=1970406 RepID=UPI000BD6857E|nr:fumarylacetoacetate hydrolase family protein [Novosphingobium sp. 17-62-19]OYX92246.1 MAG: 2-keto-4-pentenoate hydratase [Novosphingobium sp. 35-62-5]OZA16881.1 MAG: 2-keto-4-pentenoate hydratase [Novosphingobium sp. 17-62-19]OZA66817.1 MAG: 2-keto-4-pentenoate hydratase [Sphingomonadales bacterium 39-62-4]HQS97754.1 fumarylacetoacetate hydrolase family protein [Novosphingobium sp.]